MTVRAPHVGGPSAKSGPNLDSVGFRPGSGEGMGGKRDGPRLDSAAGMAPIAPRKVLTVGLPTRTRRKISPKIGLLHPLIRLPHTLHI